MWFFLLTAFRSPTPTFPGWDQAQSERSLLVQGNGTRQKALQERLEPKSQLNTGKKKKKEHHGRDVSSKESLRVLAPLLLLTCVAAQHQFLPSACRQHTLSPGSLRAR